MASSFCQLNSNAALTPRCAVVQLSDECSSASSFNRCCSRLANISDNDKSGSSARYRPTNSNPNGRYPNQLHNSAAVCISCSTRFFPTNTTSSSKDSSGDNTSKDISSTILGSRLRSLVVISRRKRLFVGSSC